MKMVYVKWLDASYQRGELSEDEFNPQIELETCGFLAKETETTISVALDYWYKDKLWRYVQHIPKVLIIKIKELTIRELS